MKLSLKIGQIEVIGTNTAGETILNYKVEGYSLEANIAGLVEAGLALKAEIENKLASEEVRLAMQEIKTATQQ